MEINKKNWKENNWIKRARAIDRVRYAEWNKSAPRSKSNLFHILLHIFCFLFCCYCGDTQVKRSVCSAQHTDEQHVLDRYQIQREMRLLISVTYIIMGCKGPPTGKSNVDTNHGGADITQTTAAVIANPAWHIPASSALHGERICFLFYPRFTFHWVHTRNPSADAQHGISQV